MSKRWLGLLLLGVWIGGSGVAQAAFNESPDPLTFPDTVVGQSNTADATLSATGGTNVTVTVALAVGGTCSQFQILSPTGAVTVDSSTNQTVTVKFAPTSPGDKSCTIDVKQGGTVIKTFTTSGRGIAPQIAITDPVGLSLTFGSVDVNQTSTAQPVTAKNNGDAPLTIASADLTTGMNDYVVTGGPSAAIPPGMTATWNIACKPSASGALSGVFHIVSDSFTNKAIDIALGCTGVEGKLATDQPTLDFGPVQRGTTRQLTFKLSNTGNVPVTGIAAVFDQAAIGYAIDATTVPTMLAASGSAMVKVTFTPQSRSDGGAATLTFSGKWGTSQTATTIPVALGGQEASFALPQAPTTLDFGSFRFDAHPQLTFDVVNDGNATLAIQAPFTPDPGTAATEYQLAFVKGATAVTPPVMLAAGEQLTIAVTPQVRNRIGAVSGELDVISDSAGSQKLTVTGLATSAQVAIDPMSGLDFGVVDVNGPPQMRTVTIQNTGDGMLDVLSLTTIGPAPGVAPSPAFSFQLPSTPSQLAPGAKLDIPVVYQPTEANLGDQTDAVVLSAELGGSLAGSATIKITGSAVFSEAHGSGGCSTGGGRSGGRSGGLLVGLAALAALRRRRHRRRVGGPAVAAAVAALALAPLARAGNGDDIGIAVFDPTPATTGAGFALQAPDVGAGGSWVMSAVASYASNPLVLDAVTSTGARSSTSALVERSTLMQIGAAYALLDRFELGAHLPIYQQSGEPGMTGTGSAAASGTALGNLALHAKARLARIDAGVGRLVAGASAAVVVPTASNGQFTGSDQPELRLVALGSFTPAALGARLAVSVNAGPVLRGKSTYANIVEQSGVAWGAGASYRIMDELWATAELFGESTPSGLRHQSMAGASSSDTLSQVEALAGLVIKPDRRISIGLALGRGVTDAIGTPDLRGVLSLSIVPGAAPIAALARAAERPDGDADGDGIPDSADKCPNEPEDRDMFEDSDGCPDPDNDHDGILDASDKCPLDPEDKDGFQDDDGCPDKDNDRDGIPDASDKCPNEPEDKDGFQDLDGCPDPDNDGDGIPDGKDRCPNEPETINGIQDDDGCPDKGDSTIILSPDRIETLDPIQFTGVKLNRASYPVLGQVAATLRAHGEIVRVRVTVHVQPTDNPDADQARSDKRAQAIRDWLVQWGIAPARLEARGFGGSKPLVPREQRGAAKINDRLELIILERK